MSLGSVISSSETASTAITDRAVKLMPRQTSSHTSAHETSAIGSPSAPVTIPVWRRKACVNTAMPGTEIGGNTM
jgi:hypothetical protein